MKRRSFLKAIAGAFAMIIGVKAVAAKPTEKTVAEGAMYRFGFEGPIVRYPQRGETVTLSSARDAKGGYLWDIEWANGSLKITGEADGEDVVIKSMKRGSGRK